MINVLSFYSFIDIADPKSLFPKILLIGKQHNLFGTVLLSHEGFNASVSGSKEDIQILFDKLVDLTKAKTVNSKVNYCSFVPFTKFKVKLKKEIVTMGIDDLDMNKRGIYVKPADWDDFILQDNVIVVDTRNDYETDVGFFKNSIIPDIKTFRAFPQWVNDNEKILKGKKIAMHCTGGIRCEKTTAYMISLGYSDIYHLEGGILQYFEDTKNKNNLWEGTCFVFDDRKQVDSNLNAVRFK